VINGNGRHAGSDVDSAPARTGKVHAKAALRTIIDETTARLDIPLREKTWFGSAFMREGWNSTRLASNLKEQTQFGENGRRFESLNANALALASA